MESNQLDLGKQAKYSVTLFKRSLKHADNRGLVGDQLLNTVFVREIQFQIILVQFEWIAQYSSIENLRYWEEDYTHQIEGM